MNQRPPNVTKGPTLLVPAVPRVHIVERLRNAKTQSHHNICCLILARVKQIESQVAVALHDRYRRTSECGELRDGREGALEVRESDFGLPMLELRPIEAGEARVQAGVMDVL
jgi:hypothetical protein